MFNKEGSELVKSLGAFWLWKLQAFLSGTRRRSLGMAPHKQETSLALTLEGQQSPRMEGKVSFCLGVHPFMSSSSSGRAGR